MNVKLFYFLINRYLLTSWLSKKNEKQGSSVGVIVPVLGIAVGVFSFTVIIAIMSGFVGNIKKELIKLQPHAQIYEKNKDYITANEQFITKIKTTYAKDILEVSPFVTGDAILQKTNQGSMVSVTGIEPETAVKIYQNTEQESVSSIEKAMTTLSQKNLDNQNIHNMIIGEKLAENLGLKVGDHLSLISIISDEGLAPLQIPFVISGIFRSGRVLFDSKNIFISIQMAQKFFSCPKKWSGLNLKIQNPFYPEALMQTLNTTLLPKNLKAESWLDANKALLKALKLEHIGMSFVTLMIIFVGCFSITISLLISLRRKTKELAILQSLGLTKRQLSFLYLGQGFFMGLFGVVIGLLASAGVLYFISHFTIPYLTTSYSNAPLPFVLSYLDVAIISFGSLILATLAALLPAKEVQDLNVTEILALRS